MTWPLGIAVFVIIWWIVLFAVLPFGVKSQQEAGEVVTGSDPGAPVVPRLGLKLLATTLIAGLLWLAVDIAYISYVLEE